MSTPAGITRRAVVVDLVSSIEAGEDLGVIVTVRSTVPELVWASTGDMLVSDVETVIGTPATQAQVPLIPTDLAGWTINGSPVDVSGGKQSHAYMVSVQPYRLNNVGGRIAVGSALTYKNVVVPSGTDPIPLDSLVEWSGDAGVVTLSKLDFVPSTAPVALVAIYANGAWPTRASVIKAFTDAGLTFTGYVLWFDPTGTAPFPPEAVYGDQFAQGA